MISLGFVSSSPCYNIFFFSRWREKLQESDGDMVIYGELPTYIGKVGDYSVSLRMCVREKVAVNVTMA